MNSILLAILMLAMNVIQATQSPGTAPATPPAPAATEIGVHSVFEFVAKGGPVMVLIALLSVVALAIIVERLVFLRARRVVPPGFVEGLRTRCGDRRAALEFCRADPSPIAAVLGAAVKNAREPRELLEKRVEEAAQQQVTRLRKYMRVMSALPQVSTMLGLLGTVFGMIKTFQSVAASSEALGKTELLARGIYEAWTATAGGLLVAIPVLVAYHALLGIIDARTAEIERVATEWLEADGEPGGVATVVEVRPSITADAAPSVPAGAVATA